MNIIENPAFKKAAKKLHRPQKEALDFAVKLIVENPKIGDAKIGNLAGLFVYKFRMVGHIILLAYTYNDQTITLNCSNSVRTKTSTAT